MANQRQEVITLGRQIFELVEGHERNEEGMVTIGKTIHGLIAAAVKAALPGRQSEENTKEVQQAAQKAFARKLSRKVAKL